MVRYIFSREYSKKHSPRTVGTLLLLIICFSMADASVLSEWKYSHASSALQQGDYAQAQEVMRNMLVDEPNRPDLLYDLGTTSFKNKEYEQAAAYFKSACEAPACPVQLQEQALYNLGNTCVELKELSDAIVYYERALEINDKNEYTKHNLEVVKKMLDDQKQQDQQQDKKDDQQKDKENKQDQKDQKNKDQNQGGDQQKDKEDSSKGDDGQENENESGDQKENDKSGKSDQKKDQKDKDNPKDGAKDKDKKDGKGDKDKTDKQSKPEKSDKQKPQPDDQQKNIDAEQDSKNSKGEVPKPSAAQQADSKQKLDLAPEDKWILQVLDRRENDEKKTNKALMRATVDKKLAGQDGKNCW